MERKGTGELWAMSDEDLKGLAAQNSEAWHGTESQEEKDGYHAENTEINKILDSRTGEHTTFDPTSGEWSPRKEPPAGGDGQAQGTGSGPVEFSYEKAPEYLEQNQALIDEMREKLMGRAPFSYDPETDPSYQQYKKQYTRLGEQAMEDTMGQMAARTGGLASSYAGSAAQQSYNQYMSALGDKIPELRQLAYEMYKGEGDDMRSDLNMLLALEQMEYGKYLDKLGQYNTEKSFAYGQWSDQQEREYRTERDRVADGRYEEEKDYQRGRDKRQDAIEDHDRAVSQALNIYNATGDATGLAEAWELSPEQAQALVDEFAWQKNLTREDAARQVADWYAQYGDFSKLKEIGVDTSYLESQRGPQVVSEPPKVKETEEEPSPQYDKVVREISRLEDTGFKGEVKIDKIIDEVERARTNEEITPAEAKKILSWYGL